MKKIYLLLFLLVPARQFFAQTINCDSFCVVSIEYDTMPGRINVTIANNDTNFINYPIVQLIDANNDTVANKQKTFNFFGQLDHTIQTYNIPTTLDSFPANWSGLVRLEDGLFHNACIIYFCEQVPVAVADIEEDFDFKVYPNPASTMVHIAGQGNFKAGLYDLLGRQVQSAWSFNNQHTFHLTGLSGGMYYLRVHMGERVKIYPLQITAN